MKVVLALQWLASPLHIVLDGLVGKGSSKKIENGGDKRQNSSEHLGKIKEQVCLSLPSNKKRKKFIGK